ncbi:Ff.00g119210.m01.CDS01 [Fusarium sp. VM40]|nr:Ff.00g119210.m01.CDS01 [Fusarium sp. VM40]
MTPSWQARVAKQAYERRDARVAEREANNPGSGVDAGGGPRDTPAESSRQRDSGRTSGAGHGNFAPDRHRGQSSNAQALSARHGVNKTRAADKPAPLVLSGELQRYETMRGNSLDPVNTSARGGLEADLMWNANKDQLRGLISQPEDGERVVRLVQEQTGAERVIIRAKNSGTDRVFIRAYPYRPDLIAAAERDQVPVTITSSDGTVRFRNMPGSPNARCCSCDSPGHTLNNCLASSETGVIEACILCNSSSHLTDGCAQFVKLSLSGKLNVLVTERAGKPPLATVKSWWDYLLDWYKSDETRDEQAPTAFPWRQEFAARVNRGDFRGKSVEDYQSEFNRHGSSASPVDNEMQTLSDVFYRYWKGKETPVPSRVQAQIGRAPLNP